jgi:hypothetical protein
MKGKKHPYDVYIHNKKAKLRSYNPFTKYFLAIEK